MNAMGPNMWETNDDLLLEELKAAMRPSSPVPDDLVEAGKAAFAWRGVDEELEMLSLSYDSSLAPAAAVRSAPTSERVLVFASEDVTMTLEVGSQVLMGQVVPASPDRVVIENADGPVDATEADTSGFFLLRRPAAGPVRLTWQTGGSKVVTEWVPL
jgi:hypothetical protein